MIGNFKDLTFGRRGEQIITLTVRADMRNIFDELKDKDLDITIKKHRKRRSLDANAYAWVLIDRLAEKLAVSKEEIYRAAIKDIGGVSEIVCVQEKAVPKLCEVWCGKGIGWQTEITPSKIPGCSNVVLYYGSSSYDTKQMSLLIDRLVQDAKSVGIETMSQMELDALLNAYDKRGVKGGKKHYAGQ